MRSFRVQSSYTGVFMAIPRIQLPRSWQYRLRLCVFFLCVFFLLTWHCTHVLLQTLDFSVTNTVVRVLIIIGMSEWPKRWPDFLTRILRAANVRFRPPPPPLPHLLFFVDRRIDYSLLYLSFFFFCRLRRLPFWGCIC